MEKIKQIARDKINTVSYKQSFILQRLTEISLEKLSEEDINTIFEILLKHITIKELREFLTPKGATLGWFSQYSSIAINTEDNG